MTSDRALVADLPGVPAALAKKMASVEVRHLAALPPASLAHHWKLTSAQWFTLSRALIDAGRPGLGEYPAPPEKEERAPSLKGKCRKAALHGPCALPLLPGKRSCVWHWLLSQPIEEQVKWAQGRREAFDRTGEPVRARVAESDWPEDHRWCAPCQAMVPLIYVRGTRCVAHASQAAHHSMVKATYDLAPADYDGLLAWQGGRCYICRQVPRVRRLAVDHDHGTGAVRGLLCANDEWGCNHALARLLNSASMAARAYEYVTRSPMDRWRAGEALPADKPTTEGGDPWAAYS